MQVVKDLLVAGGSYSTISLYFPAPQCDLSVGPGDGVEQHNSPDFAAGTADYDGG